MRVACDSAVLSRPASGETAPAGLRVLLADDSPELLASAVRLLELLPKSEVRCVGSGKEMLAELEWFSPHVIFLNVILPDMDGLKLAQRIKQSPDPPRVVILSSSSDPQYWSMARAAGADRLISKGRFFVELLHCIATLLQKSPTETAPIDRAIRS